ncbi:hypothetical protein [Hanstruepera flava]|uniref:hypothetical protein n=1 Tax=Hanstruepera flava TaxID=2930218 RepID=UPI0020287D4F|nr:hypothetical protein [Hanstruepera flava]
MKKITQLIKGSLYFALIITMCFSTYAQVGIGTTSPNSNALLDIDASTNVGGLLLPRMNLTSTASFAPLSAHVQGMSVYNTATINDVTPGQYYNNGSRWVRVEQTAPIQSVSVNTDFQISSASWTNITGASLTFTATKTSVLIMFTASGFGYTNSMAFVQIRARNGTTSIGGSNTKIQSYDDLTGTVTPWSLAFNKLLTGLTIGNTYTIQLQGQVGGIFGTPNAAIFANTNPDYHHLTLTVLQ